jgi:hypothetical protein
LIRRHASLRAAFRYERLRKPVQIILRDAAAPWTRVDLSSIGEAKRDSRLATLLKEDRQRRFDVGRPPLLRFTLVRLAEQCHRLIMTNHHLVADGWSKAILLEEIWRLYEHNADPRPLPAVVPYREYLAWLAGRDREAANAAWTGVMAGLERPHLLESWNATCERRPPSQHVVSVDERALDRLLRRARALRVTLNMIVQSAWAIALHELTSRTDIVFGAVVSGRPPELDGVERMVGLFINTVPVRVRVADGDSLVEVLARLEEWQIQTLTHQWLGLNEIQRLTRTSPLFDSLVAFENYPAPRIANDSLRGLQVTAFAESDDSHYPLTLQAVRRDGLEICLDSRSDRIGQDGVADLGAAVSSILSAFAENPWQTVEHITSSRHNAATMTRSPG